MLWPRQALNLDCLSAMLMVKAAMPKLLQHGIFAWQTIYVFREEGFFKNSSSLSYTQFFFSSTIAGPRKQHCKSRYLKLFYYVRTEHENKV